MWCTGDKIKFTSVLCANKASIWCFSACNAIIYGSLNVMHHFLCCKLTQLRYTYFLMQSYECMRFRFFLMQPYNNTPYDTHIFLCNLTNARILSFYVMLMLQRNKHQLCPSCIKQPTVFVIDYIYP